MERILERFRDVCRVGYLQLEPSYHNFEHALDVERTAQELADIVRRNGTKVDLNLLRAAAWGHDLRFDIDPATFSVADEGSWRSTTCKEEVAAHMSANALYELGASAQFAYAVKQAIMATNPAYGFSSVEGMLLAAADLRLVGHGSYRSFLANGELLRLEAERLSGRPISPKSMACGAASYLGLFTARRIMLSPNYFTEDGRSAWHMGAITNICRMVRDKRDDPQTRVIAELSDSSLPLAAVGSGPSFSPTDIYIFVGRTWKKRKTALASLGNAFKRWGLEPLIALSLPVEEGVISCPSRLFDEIYVPAGEAYRYAVEEVDRPSSAGDWRRLLKAGGTLHLYEKQVTGLGPAYRDTGQMAELIEWLKPKRFIYQGEESPPYGWGAIFSTV